MFNKALLANQLWRIMQHPTSLVAKIMQAKYFPRSNILDAKLGSRPSFAWRSMLTAKEIVQQRAFWRVGNGKDIRMWGDCWMPTPSSFAVHSPRLHLPENSVVGDLIDPETKQWNRPLIEQNFLEEEVEVILSIPLSPFLPNDKLI